MDLTKYIYAIFDCDGVILDSNAIKTEAFRLSLDNEPKYLVEKFIEYHKSNGGVSRYVKFDYFFTTMKGVDDSTVATKRALDKYSRIVKDKLLACDFIPGIYKVLEIFQENKIPCIVISGGDEQELQEVFEKRQISKYFFKIFGSPKTKLENMQRLHDILDLYQKGVYFGDARSDYEVASEFNQDFVFVEGRSEWHDWGKYKIGFSDIIEDFSSIPI